ncbi:hypothetical protein H4R20_005548 [Coemansia guatemalensis]|uniref:RTA1-domain-containing protein n=1 Tax=Coemansia guatemalensis TaxID=2761395 RepID=A0A9W8HU14_9FUNG|nr:hypothetical protein H4R20_005548 [Coemansia guatemalensis]
MERASDFDNEDIDERLRYFTYIPKDVYPEVAMSLFFIAAVILVWQIVHYRAQRWLYILPGTALAEAIGYAVRIVCIHQMSFAAYVVMTLFLLVPVNALALANYKAVAVVIRERQGPKERFFFLRPRFVTWFYFSSDIFSIAMQGAGGGMMTGDDDTRDVGKVIVLIGLIVQLFFFSCFLATCVYVWRNPEYNVHVSKCDRNQRFAKMRVLGAVSATTVLIYLRSIYRIAEFADGYGGKIYSAEWAFYVFDAILIFLAFVVYIVVFIGHNFPRRVHGRISSPEDGNAPAGSSMHLVYKEEYPQPSV